MRQIARNQVYILLMCILSMVIALSVFPCGENYASHAQASTEIIDTKDKLETALANANDGDVIEIGNITYSTGDFWLSVKKSVTLKSAFNDRATITGGLGIRGGTIESERISVRLENINFVGFNNLAEIEFVDGKYLYSQPNITCKQCLVISGFVDIKIENCDFSGFAQTIGGAINAMYGKSSESENCRLSLSLNNCKFHANVANQGSAMYLYGYNNNIKLNMTYCEVTDNVQQRAPIALFGTVAKIQRCLLANNRMLNFYSYGGGGAVYAKESQLDMVDCTVTNNQATDGGGIYLYYTQAYIDGCVIAGNTTREITVTITDFDYDTGEELYSYETMGGYGGGIYIDGNKLLRCYIVNSSIYGNTSQHDGGAMFVNYRNDATIRVECALSTIGMKSTSNGDLISSTSAQYEMTVLGCILIADDTVGEPLSADENYNYSASAAQLIEAGVFSQQNLESATEHLTQKNIDITIPQSELSQWANGKYKNAYGKISIGANGTQPTIITYAGAEQSTIVAYGEDYKLITPSKVGFTFIGWKTAKKGGEAFTEGKLLMGGEITLYPDWKPNVSTIVLPIVAFVIVLAAGIVLVVVKRKKACELQVEQEAMVVEIGSDMPTIIEPIREKVELIKDEYKLSAREAEVIGLLLEDKTARMIAEELFISFDTVRFHCKNVYKKLSVHSQAELKSFCQKYTKD